MNGIAPVADPKQGILLTDNIQGNLAIGGAFDDIRIIADDDTISRVDEVLNKWAVK